MAKRKLRAVADESPERFLHNLDDKYVFCRAQRHTGMPKIKRRGPLPRGMTAEVREGRVWVIYKCQDCGVKKFGILGDPSSFRYDYSEAKGYLAPKGTGIKHADSVDEFERRVREDIEAQATTPRPKAKPRIEVAVVPEVKFLG